MTRLTSAALLTALIVASTSKAEEKDAKGIAFFESKIRPVLINSCYECHSAQSAKVKGGLLLDTRDGLRNGGDTGPSIVPGSPDKSLLIKSLRHDDIKMPPKKQLPASVVADFVEWVRMGAPDPRTAASASGYKRMTAEEAKTFWSFLPPKKADAPKTKGDWARTDIDRFILAAMEAKGLTPNGDAERRTLIRRLSFDLTGLPPTPEEVEAFVSEHSAKPQAAVEKLVDRLLASKHFGERWGRHWLDLARYAESNGNADNTPFPHAWRYRDYVIKSFNDDKPYDRFVREQVAGDLLDEKDAKKKDEALAGTAFLALTSKPRAQNNPDFRMDLIADQVDVTTRAVLGLTVMCARCHDHKFDYVSTKEYYALAGIFDSSAMLAGGGGQGNRATPGANGFHTLSDGGMSMGIKEGRMTDCAVCIRGETQNKGETVKRGFLNVGHAAKAPEIPSSSSGRLQLAEWLSSKDNTLTARVAVNRIWLHLFGRGIVDSPDNFGYLGERPTHPELLDWLAVQFMEDGWSTKKMIRKIVLSRVYQLSSEHHAANYKSEPDNRYLWRANTRRLEGEAIRDAVLATSGQLKLDPPTGSASASEGAARRPNYTIKDIPNRSIYLANPRGAAQPELLSLFDMANPNLVVSQREVTTVPAQALFLMNSPFMRDQATHLAKRALTEKDLDDAGRVELLYRLTLSRLPDSMERERALKFITGTGGREAAWAGFCQMLYASAEFRYLN